MTQAMICIGMGEMGSVFARGFLQAGYSVIPVRRNDDISEIARQNPEPVLVLVSVGESDLSQTLDSIPAAWKNKLTLLQNELLPGDWKQKNLQDPTVISVWFEKKKGMDYRVLVPSPVYGPVSEIIQQSLATLNIPVDILAEESELLFELVRKNMYILTTNICGLETGGNVAQLWNDHTILMNKVFDDVLEIQQHLSGQVFNRDHLLNAVLTAFDGDPEHQCMGRSAPQRLQRALQIALQANIQVPELERISQNIA